MGKWLSANEWLETGEPLAPSQSTLSWFTFIYSPFPRIPFYISAIEVSVSALLLQALRGAAPFRPGDHEGILKTGGGGGDSFENSRGICNE
jgi:hypothetical protein